MTFIDQDIRLDDRVNGGCGIGTELTHPLQVPMGDIQAVKVLQPSRSIYQLWRPVILVLNVDMETYKLDSIHFPVVLDEIVDITVIHPF